jgi:hypothetical protein
MEGSIEWPESWATGIRYEIRFVPIVHKLGFKTALALVEWC